MAEITYTNNKFLSQAGLAKFWDLIKAKFVSSIGLEITEKNGAVFTINKGDGKTQDPSLVIPIASTAGAGLMSADQAKTVDEFSDGVNALIPLTAVKVKGTAAELADRAVNIDFVYDSENKTINVVDLNKANAILTSIDATAFIKDGMLDSAELVVNPTGMTAGTYIALTFNTDAKKETIYINVTSLIDIYAAGNGLDLTERAFSIKLAADAEGDKNYLKVTEAGLATTGIDTAIKTAADKALADAKTYTDGLIDELTNANDGILAQAKKYTDDEILALNETLTAVIEENELTASNALNDLNTRVGVLEAIDHEAYKAADAELKESLEDYVDGAIADVNSVAITATKDVIGDDDYVVATYGTGEDSRDVTITLSDTAKASLAAADTAIQKVNVEEALIVTPTYADQTDATEVTIDLAEATKTKINNAVQSVSFNTNTDGNSVQVTAAQGSRDLVIDLMPLTNAEIEAIVNA